MAIDIDRVTEAELLDLNLRIVERLRFLQQMRVHAALLQFYLDDRVTFDTDDYHRGRWNVAPVFLRRAQPRDITLTGPEPLNLLLVKK